MEHRDIPGETLIQLLEQSQLPESETASRIEEALSPAFWLRVNPHLTIAGDTAGEVVEETPIDLHNRKHYVGL